MFSIKLEVLALTRQVDDVINGYYNDLILEKAVIQIKK